MKYFTLEWWGNWNDGGSKDVCKEYQLYYDSIKEKLPFDLKRLQEEVSLHDGNLVRIISNFHEGTVEIEILGYNYDANFSSTGLRRFWLKYQGVSNLASFSDPEKSLAGPSGYGDLGYDEIEFISPDCFEHRMLFSSGIEISVTFRKFTLEFSEVEK